MTIPHLRGGDPPLSCSWTDELFLLRPVQSRRYYPSCSDGAPMRVLVPVRIVRSEFAACEHVDENVAVYAAQRQSGDEFFVKIRHAPDGRRFFQAHPMRMQMASARGRFPHGGSLRNLISSPRTPIRGRGDGLGVPNFAEVSNGRRFFFRHIRCESKSPQPRAAAYSSPCDRLACCLASVRGGQRKIGAS